MANKEDLSNQIGIIVSKDNKPVPIDGERLLRLDLLDGWDSLEDPQRKFLQEYAKSPFNERMICMSLGYSTNTISTWKEDPDFQSLMDEIDDIYTEVMREADYRDSLTNPKIRGRHLKAREAKGFKEEKPDSGSKHVHLHISQLLS